MPKLNPYLIPKENIVKTEEVRYLNNEIPTYEEFLKNYKVDERIKDSYEAEYQDKLLHGPQYGPGNETSKEVVKFGIKTVGGIGLGAVIAATGPFAIPFGALAVAEGYCLKKAAETSDNEVVREAVGLVGDTVMGGGVSGTASAVVGTASSSLVSRGANQVLNSAVTTGSEELFRAWAYTKAAQIGYDLGSRSKVALEGFASFYHGLHKDKGFEYERDCAVCNGNLDKTIWL